MDDNSLLGKPVLNRSPLLQKRVHSSSSPLRSTSLHNGAQYEDDTRSSGPKFQVQVQVQSRRPPSPSSNSSSQRPTIYLYRVIVRYFLLPYFIIFYIPSFISLCLLFYRTFFLWLFEKLYFPFLVLLFGDYAIHRTK